MRVRCQRARSIAGVWSSRLRRVRVLLVTRVFAPQVGGMERFADELAGALARARHDVTVLTTVPAAANEDRDRKYPVIRSRSPGVLALAARRADVVHVSGLSARSILSCAGAGKRPFVTHHGVQSVCPEGNAWAPNGGACTASGATPGPCAACPGRGARGSLAVRVHRAAARFATVNVMVSEYLARRAGVPRSTVIANPVGAEFFANAAPGPGDDGLIVFAGRLVTEKGVDTLLRALALVPGARLEIAGDGPERPVLAALATQLGVDQRVTFNGVLERERLIALYARAAVVAISSAWDETFGYAAAEPMAMRRPIVSVPTGSVVELLANDRGFVSVDRSPESLAAALREALADPAERGRRATRAREFAILALNADSIAERYARAYVKS